MVQAKVGDKAIIFYTHSYNENSPIWEVAQVSKSGKKVVLKRDNGQEKVVTLRTVTVKHTGEAWSFYACMGVDGGKYTRIYFEGDEIFSQCTGQRKDDGEEEPEAHEVMPYAAPELLEALSVFVDKWEEQEAISQQDYAGAKNAIARAKGKPLPFPGLHNLKRAQEQLEKALDIS